MARDIDLNDVGPGAPMASQRAAEPQDIDLHEVGADSAGTGRLTVEPQAAALDASWQPSPSGSERRTRFSPQFLESPRHLGGSVESIGRLSSRSTPTRLGTIHWRFSPFGSSKVVIPDVYSVPTRVLADIFTALDQRDSPAHPGKVRFSTLKRALLNFHEVMGEGRIDKDLLREVESTLQTLHDQAHLRANGSIGKSDPMVRWDQGIYLDCFRVGMPRMERLFFTLDISENSTMASRSVSCIVMAAVVLSIITFILSTLPDAKAHFAPWVPYADISCVCIFTVDYGARLLTAAYARMELLDRDFLEEVLQGEPRQLLSRSQRLLRFVGSVMSCVDLLSVVPFWVELGLGGVVGLESMDEPGSTHSKALQLFRMVRMFRVFKLGWLAKVDLGKDRNVVLTLFSEVIRKAWPALQLVVVLILAALLVFGTLIWYAERGVLFIKNDPSCPWPLLCKEGAVRVRRHSDGSFEQDSSPFSSIPMSFWWVLVTITTVGYGDFYPITPLGYAVGSATILYGAVVFALPVGVIGTTFSQLYEHFQAEQRLRERLAEQSKQLEVEMDESLGSQDGPAIVVTEMRSVLQEASSELGLPQAMVDRWHEKLKVVTRFEHLANEHPCETLERWGNPVLAVMREHAYQQPAVAVAYSQTLAAWYRMLLLAAQEPPAPARQVQAYENFPASQERAAFDKIFHGSRGLISRTSAASSVRHK